MSHGDKSNNLFHIFAASTGPRIGSSPVRSIVQCLARKEGTDDFYTLKVVIKLFTTKITFHKNDFNKLHECTN